MNWRSEALLRPSELAEASGRSVRTIQRKVATGEIESRLEDGCRLIPISAALRFVGEEKGGPVERSVETRRRADQILAHIARVGRA